HRPRANKDPANVIAARRFMSISIKGVRGPERRLFLALADDKSRPRVRSRRFRTSGREFHHKVPAAQCKSLTEPRRRFASGRITTYAWVTFRLKNNCTPDLHGDEAWILIRPLL